MGRQLHRHPLFVRLENKSSVPLYLQLMHHIVYLIGSGELMPRMPLPSVRHLAGQLSVSTVTVQRAYAELQAQNILYAEAGRGVFVADQSESGLISTIDRTQVLSDLLMRTVSHVRSLGFSEKEIVSTVKELVANRGKLEGAPRVVFFAQRREYAEHYRLALSEALASGGYKVEGITFSELDERGEVMLDSFEPIHCFVCIAGNLSTMKKAIGHRHTPLFPLVFDATEETQAALLTLPHDQPIGLIAEDYMMSTRRAVIVHYHGDEENLVSGSYSDYESMSKILSSCSIVIYALGARKAVLEHVPPGTRLIELATRPNPASLARLRALLSGTATEDAEKNLSAPEAEGPNTNETRPSPPRFVRKLKSPRSVMDLLGP